MKLDYSPGACSVSPHICLREAGLACTPVMASTKTKKLADGSDYLTIDPKGQVPLLELADGQRLSEGPAFEGGHLRARHHASRRARPHPARAARSGLTDQRAGS
jgi:hypothetical protein